LTIRFDYVRIIDMSKRRNTSDKITSSTVVYRVVNGERKRFTMTTVATEYRATPNTIGYKCGRVKQSNGKVDPTMILASHK
jgi:hypothetical protein